MSVIWWILLGGCLGWLLSWGMSRNCCKKSAGHDEKSSTDSTQQSLTLNSEPTSKAEPKKLPSKLAKSSVKNPVLKAVSIATLVNSVDFDKASALSAGFKVKGIDDLEIIEGIGPKISILLKAEGITDFAMLAAASQLTLQGILDKAGAHYRLASPETWPEQAALANAGKWIELKVLQARLSGGKR